MPFCPGFGFKLPRCQTQSGNAIVPETLFPPASKTEFWKPSPPAGRTRRGECGRRSRSEADRNSTTNPVVGDDLESGVVDRDRQVDRDLGADLSKGGADARTEKNGGDAGVFGRLAAKAVDILVLA